MQYTQAEQGRIFILRLEQGETIHAVVEEFARRQNIHAAVLTALGGADASSTLVVGPEDGTARPVQPMHHQLPDVHEVIGSGTIFPDQEGSPVLHMHLSCGRGKNAITGCIRPGVVVWQILEIVLQEIHCSRGMRKLDPELGVGVLDCS